MGAVKFRVLLQCLPPKSMGPHKHIVGTINYAHFLPVSGHRPIKVPKDLLFQHPSGLWSRFKCSSGHLMSYCSDASANKPAILFPPNSSLRSAHNTDKCIRTAQAPCLGWSKQPCYSAWSKHIMLCRLYSWTASNFMIRNHSTAAVPGLIISDVNFNFSWAGLA